MIHIYTGTGKGKTTASLGLIVRALGHGTPVLLAQFFKTPDSGEIDFLSKQDGITIMHADNHLGFFWKLSDEDKASVRECNHRLFTDVVSYIASSVDATQNDAAITHLIVLDELMAAIKNGAVAAEEVIAMIDSLPESCELVMTGRNVPDELADRADYITDMGKTKHPFDRGIPARENVEW